MCSQNAMDTVAQAASAVVRHSSMVIGAAADELARQVVGFKTETLEETILRQR